MKLFSFRQRTLWCIALAVLVVVATMAFARAQDTAAAEEPSPTTSTANRKSEARPTSVKADAEKVRREDDKRRGISSNQRGQNEVERARETTEKAKRSVDSVDMIRYSAKELPQGCVKTVEEYLFRIHEYRRPVSAAVGDARSELNEARVHAPQNVAELEKRLAAKQDDLLVYDLKTLRMYGGNLPKTCIAESQAWLERQPVVTSTNNYVQVYVFFYRFLAAHCRTLYLTARGLVQYLIHSYIPVAESYAKTSQHYFNKAATIYAEVKPVSGKWPDMPFMDLAKLVLRMMSYAFVPIGLVVAAAIIAFVVLPALVSVVVLYEFVYKIWIELFFAYYIYGVQMPSGVITAIKGAVSAAQAGEWASIGNEMADMFFNLVVDSEKIFYNGIIAVFLIGFITALCTFFICVWCRSCIPGSRSKKNPTPLKSTRRSAKRKGGAASGAAASASAEAAAKKKN
ncbi:hypothetical protein JKF63_04839 [Porcisia hertigi]|uniref:Uncharacterized protein n=1 Tax=Porcisia hertigi TaxID=2761500 RepID=A0A836IVD3_9TRYP|nr:hypothetical protein JKF63_04839 [Porcisia hertigi]